MLLETGGHVSIADVPAGVHRIVDVKCPGSGESGRMHWDNLDLLTPRDEVKFVIADREDFEYAREVTTTHDLAQRCGAVHFSPAWNLVAPADLAAWILEAKLPGAPAAAAAQVHLGTRRATRMTTRTRSHPPAQRGARLLHRRRHRAGRTASACSR